MPDSQKFLSFFSIITGTLFTLLGIAGLGFYLYSVISALDKADQSVIFWYLVFVGVGITFIGVGIYFIIIGNKSRKGEGRSVGLVKYSLGGLGAFLCVWILLWIFNEWSANQKRSTRIKQEEIRKSLDTEMHSIEEVKIDRYDQDGFNFSVGISKGLEGSYRFNISIYNRQAVFLKESEEIMLDTSKTEIDRRISFKSLFQKCFDDFRGSNIYVCVKNSGATSFFTLQSQLILLEDTQKEISKIDNDLDLKTTGKTEFSIDTFVKEKDVAVNSFQPLGR